MDAHCVYLTTDADGNDAVSAFYRDIGFQRTRRFLRREGRWMNEYIINGLEGQQHLRHASIDRARNQRLRQAWYRLFDMACAAAGLMVLMPVLFTLAVLVVLDDGPPVFFSQMRVGRRGKLFRIWKLRTMRAGSEGGVITAAGDGRVTRVGAALRRCKLDELPQLFNVLKGDMSLVGPRPEVPECVQLEAPIWQAVLQVRPGVTDLATLLYRDEEKLLGTSFDPNALYRQTVLPAKLVLNLGYLRYRSFWRDLKLIYLTIRYSLFPERFDRELITKTVGAGVFR
jgi:lipopolysaccharide/colanic/teichoic acid biosynthesis glycosyltransferase